MTLYGWPATQRPIRHKSWSLAHTGEKSLNRISRVPAKRREQSEEESHKKKKHFPEARLTGRYAVFVRQVFRTTTVFPGGVMNDRSLIPRPAKPISAPPFMLGTDHNVNKANYQYQHLISFNEKKAGNLLVCRWHAVPGRHDSASRLAFLSWVISLTHSKRGFVLLSLLRNVQNDSRYGYFRTIASTWILAGILVRIEGWCCPSFSWISISRHSSHFQHSACEP